MSFQRTLLTLAGRFPGGHFGSVRVSSLHFETESWRFFAIGDDIILSVLDTMVMGGMQCCHSNTSHADILEPGVTVVTRDRTGKYAWELKLEFLPIGMIAPFYSASDLLSQHQQM